MGGGGAIGAALEPSLNTLVQPWGQSGALQRSQGWRHEGPGPSFSEHAFIVLRLKAGSCPGPRLEEMLWLESFELVDCDSSNTANANPYISNTLSNSMFGGKSKCVSP